MKSHINLPPQYADVYIIMEFVKIETDMITSITMR